MLAGAVRGGTGSKGGGGPVRSSDVDANLNDMDLKDFTMERSIAEGKELEKAREESKWRIDYQSIDNREGR